MERGGFTRASFVVEYEQTARSVAYAVSRATDPAEAAILRDMLADLDWTLYYLRTGYTPEEAAADSTRPKRTRIPRTVPSGDLAWVAEPVSAMWIRGRPHRVPSALQLVFDTLSRAEREAYVLVRGEMLSYRESARLLRKSRASVQTLVKRAEAKIKREITAVALPCRTPCS